MATATAPARTLTNQELGDIIGCTHSMASRLRAGKRLPGLDTLQNIHREFGVSWDDLINARNKGQAEFGKVFRAAIVARASQPAR